MLREISCNVILTAQDPVNIGVIDIRTSIISCTIAYAQMNNMHMQCLQPRHEVES